VWGDLKGNVYIAGWRGTLLRSADGGGLWKLIKTDLVEDLGAIWGRRETSSARARELYAVGSLGIILRSSDAGSTWSRRASGTKHALTGAAGDSDNVLVVGHGGTILRRRAD
jgi:hypothetical protein